MIAFAAVLVAWGNATSVILGPGAALPGGSAEYVLAGAALAAISFAAARADGLDASALGGRRVVRGAAIGVALGAIASIAGVAALRLVAPAVIGYPVDYAPLARFAGPDLAWHVAVLLPLAVVVPEEIAFRGVLLGAIARERGGRAAIATSSASFALWHGAVVLATVAATTIGPLSPWSPVAVAGGLAVVAAGGVLFAWLRLATGTLATTVAAHWTFNAVVLVGLWWTR